VSDGGYLLFNHFLFSFYVAIQLFILYRSAMLCSNYLYNYIKPLHTEPEANSPKNLLPFRINLSTCPAWHTALTWKMTTTIRENTWKSWVMCLLFIMEIQVHISAQAENIFLLCLCRIWIQIWRVLTLKHYLVTCTYIDQ
jgi:hypothetical protein